MKEILNKICMTVFEITLPLFMLLGAVLVFTQIAGALMGNGALVLGANNALKTYAIWAASVCAAAGFIMGYCKKGGKHGD